MTTAEQATATSDPTYNLVSVLYHALQEGSTFEQYVEDAERESDSELAEFFREIQAHDREVVQRAKSLLSARLGR